MKERICHFEMVLQEAQFPLSIQFFTFHKPLKLAGVGR